MRTLQGMDIPNRSMWSSGALLVATGMVLGHGTAFSADVTLHGRVSQAVQRPMPVQVVSPLLPGVIGLELEIRSGYPVRILRVFRGTPAESARLRPGDWILAIDHRDTRGMSRPAVDTALPDTPGTPVVLLIQRGSQTFVSPLRVGVLSGRSF